MTISSCIRIKTLVAAVAVLAFVSVHSPAAERTPNIVLIVADDLGYEDTSPFGGEAVTPNIERLAREGVQGMSFYVTGPGCTSSRSGLLTGRYPNRNGMYEMIRNDMVNYGHQFTWAQYQRQPEATLGMDLREWTLGDMLKKAGYRNGFFGKWDLGRPRRYLPLQRGWDDFFGIVNTGTDYWTHERYGIHSLYRNNEPTHEEGFLVELEGRECVRFIHENHDRPFFLYFPSFAPHGASNLDGSGIRAPQEYVGLYPGRDPQDRRTQYLAAVSSMDVQIGKILDLLDHYGIADNTLVIFFSDQGATAAGSNKPFRGGKGTLWDGGVRSPFIARWPGVIEAGTKTTEFISSLELMPTFAAVAKTWVPDATMDGFNMLPVLKGEAPSQRTEIFWDLLSGRAARVGNYKWVEMSRQRGGGLFDLSKDVGEQHDLSAEKPEVLARVKARWDEWRREMDNVDPRGPFTDF